MHRRLTWRALALVVAAVLGAAACGGGGKKNDAGPDTTVGTSTTTSTTTTAAPKPDAPAAPLTGVPVGDLAVLSRPALVVKIDNADAKSCTDTSRPQVGIVQADLVLDILVEGITRFMAVYQSELPEIVGPIRSARSSDVDLIQAFGKPLFAWSGNNGNVEAELGAIRSSFVNVGHSSGAGSVYYRAKDRCAPHNLLANPADLFDNVPEPGTPPAPVFAYRAKNDALPSSALPAGGVEVTTGQPVVYAWNATTSSWDRYQKGTLHTDAGDKPVSPQNVLVLITRYVESSTAGSPEAVTTGEGQALVFSAGKVVVGTWKRPDAKSGWTLTDASGAPVKLTPGKTWVSLAREGTVNLLSPDDVKAKVG